MRNFKNISKSLVIRIGAVCILAVMLSSCLKSHYDDTPAPPVALLTVIQASPGQPQLDFTIDNTRVNSMPINFGDNVDYFRAYAGRRKATFSKTGGGGTVASDSITLKENVAYSLFLTNVTATPQLLLLTDSLTRPSAGNANVRFINLSPDAPKVDFAVQGGSVLAANLAFKDHSAFQSIPGKSYSFEIRQAGTSTVLTTLNNVTLNSGYIYTIYLKGIALEANPTQTLSASLITNAYYN